MLDYELLDFGDGRRLERFGRWVIDRPCPAAERFAPSDPAAWRRAVARFERIAADRGRWTFRGSLPERWTVDAGRFRLELKPSPFGHLGVFPEQAANWAWIAEQITKSLSQNHTSGGSGIASGGLGIASGGLGIASGGWGIASGGWGIAKRCPRGSTTGPSLCSDPAALPREQSEPRPSGSGGGGIGDAASPLPNGRGSNSAPAVLHLFAYTGASTLAAAAAGAGEVVHVDAARNTVAWARRNAELSGLTDAPIRWVVEDARKFVRRELRRGNSYDAVILDPPSYGHGRRGEVWQLERDLGPLLADCAELTAGRRGFVLLTAHTPEFDAARLARMLGEALAEPVAPRRALAEPVAPRRALAEPVAPRLEPPGAWEASTMTLRAVDGRELPSGAVVRWHSGPGGTPRTK